jgi:hypothetical protein
MQVVASLDETASPIDEYCIVYIVYDVDLYWLMNKNICAI